MAVLLLIDAVLLPSLVRKRRALEAGRAPPPTIEVADAVSEVHEAGVGEDPTLHLHTRLTDAIEWINVRAGQYVAWWSLMAVFVYYYEVIARFVFNSPTNWVHESMFLMFGMQYMLSGAYAYREDQHVRVDVVYAKFSPRGKAIADIITSVFFFIFIGTTFGDRLSLRGRFDRPSTSIRLPNGASSTGRSSSRCRSARRYCFCRASRSSSRTCCWSRAGERKAWASRSASNG